MRFLSRFVGSVASVVALLSMGCSSSSKVSTSGDAGTDAGSDAGIDSPLGNALPVDATLQIQNLSGPVDVVRDKNGRPHIYATSTTDAMRVEGYLVAGDRHAQLDFFRRVSEGRVSEVFGSLSTAVVDLDITYRHIGLARTAQAEYAALAAGPVKDALDAYADGVTQAFRKIRAGTLPLPAALVGYPPSAFTDWTGADSLAVARFETYELSYDADTDIANQVFFDAARMTFTAADPDPATAKRAGLERDLFRFAPADPATTTTGYPTVPEGQRHVPHAADARALPHGASRSRLPHAKADGALAATSGYLEAMRTMRRMWKRAGFGSNNWAVAPSHSATGHSLIASDPHLSLSAPSVFWPVSIDVKVPAGGDASGDLSVAGLAFPGIPAIILGHNASIAWGATVAGYDVSDAYKEQLTPDGKSVVFNGQNVAIQTVDEVIKLDDGTSFTYAVQIVPQHGPIVPNIVKNRVVPADPTTGAISIKWTGLAATHELEAIFALLKATDVDSAQTALNQFGVGGQNWMIGDTSGHILWTSHVLVPTRDPRAFTGWQASTYTGALPCFVLPGDGTTEWTGFLPDGLVPWQKDPAAGYMSTANNDPIGNTLDNDPSNDKLPDGTPMYLACTYDIGFREGKIHARLGAHTAPLALTDLATIQGDDQSSMGTTLAPALVLALEAAAAEKQTPGTHPDLTSAVSDPTYDVATMKVVHDALVAWGAAGYHAMSGVDPTTNMPLPASGATAAEAAASQATLFFNAWQVRLYDRVFGDELAKMNGSFADDQQEARAMIRLVTGDPTTFATYDATTSDSSLWDDLATTTVVESRNDRMVRSMLDALADLATVAGADISTYRWGAQHTITFQPVFPLWTGMAIPTGNDPVFGKTGFPRHGDRFNIDAADFDFAGVGQPFDFTYGAGPTQRFVVDMDPAGPHAWNVLPGGEIWNPASPHFADEAELWRRNQNHPVPYLLADVIAAAESRTLVTPP
jgi:penicillin amidase